MYTYSGQIARQGNDLLSPNYHVLIVLKEQKRKIEESLQKQSQ
jgi:hypothetical protein